jgi:hypothetical protein
LLCSSFSSRKAAAFLLNVESIRTGGDKVPAPEEFSEDFFYTKVWATENYKHQESSTTSQFNNDSERYYKMHNKLRLCLLIGITSLLFIGNAYARPSFGGDCSVCHIAPTVTDFVLPASHDSLTVPIDTFSATDTDNQKQSLVGVTGYMVTTSPTAPSSGDAGWQSSPPSEYTFANEGLQTLYAWAKDVVGNVSAAVSSTVDVALAAANNPPTADAGPDQTVDEGVTVALNGSNSDDSDDGIATFLWEQVGSANPVTLSDPAAEQPTFSAPDVGPEGAALTFRLTVTDNSGDSSSDTCIVNVSWVNIAPVADAGSDQTVGEGTLVALDGSASSGVDDNIATYLWEQVDTSGIAADLSDPTAVNPDVTISGVGADGASLTFQLTVTDQGGLQATDTCVINVTNSNQAPVANAGDNQNVATGAEVILDASGSSDPDGGDLTYTWKQIAGTAVTLTAPSAMNPIFTAPAVAAGSTETLTFELTVTDGGQLQATDTCDVQVAGEELPPVVDPPPVVEPPVDQPPVEEPPVIQPPVNDDDQDENSDDSSYDDGENRHYHEGGRHHYHEGNRHHHRDNHYYNHQSRREDRHQRYHREYSERDDD